RSVDLRVRARRARDDGVADVVVVGREEQVAVPRLLGRSERRLRRIAARIEAELIVDRRADLEARDRELVRALDEEVLRERPALRDLARRERARTPGGSVRSVRELRPIAIADEADEVLTRSALRRRRRRDEVL